MKHENSTPASKPLSEEHIKKIKDLLKEIQYGTITLVIQDGTLIQIEHTERERLR